MQAVADGRADALVSGGSTGAALAAGLFQIKRARGIHRPALAVLVPVPGAPFLLLDAGANVAVRPEHLVQFAHMGAAFSELVLGVERPRVALLSNGDGARKGPEVVVAAHRALAERPAGLEFVGNVEGFAIGAGSADVIVADGYAGNVALKVMEGTSAALFDGRPRGGDVERRARGRRRAAAPGAARGCATSSTPRSRAARSCSDCGGSAWCPHGSFGARGFQRAIELAARGVREDLVAARTSACWRQARCAAAEASAAVASVPEP